MGSSPQRIGQSKPKKVRLLYARRVSLFSFLVALPGVVVSTIFIWQESWTIQSKLGLLVLIFIAWGLLAMTLQENATRPLQTLANVVAALREEDYSFRARNAVPEDALGELSLEVNALADMLADQRTRAIEATALLRKVVEEIDVPIFAFDPHQILQLVNSAGEKLLQTPSVRLMGRTAEEIGLQNFLAAANESLVPLPSSGTQTRWLVRRSLFRQNGVPHTLLVLSDVSRALREEERSAWQRLVRVLGHELNNSLAPIKSIAGSLHTRISRASISAEEKQDFGRGLEIIETRADSLNRFLQAYRQLAQMPSPVLRQCRLPELVTRVAGLETRLPITVAGGPDVFLLADSDQLEQMLINIFRNAAEAALDQAQGNGKEPSRPEVIVGWQDMEKEVVLTIEDNGPGLLNPANAFVPFYTTKPAGSGIGLVLSREIVEAHGGSIELSNRKFQRGCQVKIVLPLMMDDLLLSEV
jgi:two-component system, NtrC family, nitrogen regulation sensor histidine kinase NtrY